MRGLKPAGARVRVSPVPRVRRERILVRGLKPAQPLVDVVFRPDGQKRTNPREGIETEVTARAKPLLYHRQKRTNPREGIETPRLPRFCPYPDGRSEENESS